MPTTSQLCRTVQSVRPKALALTFAMLFGAFASSSVNAQSKPPRLSPKRLSAIGDSITAGVNAEEFNIIRIANPNPWASFSNGYQGFWEWLLGRTDVNSHNQRIGRNFGSENRLNDLQAVSGSDSFNLLEQAQGAVEREANYVTLFMGHNDVCQNDFADIPSDTEFEANVRAALETLRMGLPAGSTIYLIGLVDIYKLYQLGEDLDAFGFLDCDVLWATTLLNIYPCGTMLSPANTEADRLFTRSRNLAFNTILRDLASEYNRDDIDRYYAYTDAAERIEFAADDVSPFDCFHPSANGQRLLSEATWTTGPFREFDN